MVRLVLVIVWMLYFCTVIAELPELPVVSLGRRGCPPALFTAYHVFPIPRYESQGIACISCCRCLSSMASILEAQIPYVAGFRIKSSRFLPSAKSGSNDFRRCGHETTQDRRSSPVSHSHDSICSLVKIGIGCQHVNSTHYRVGRVVVFLVGLLAFVGLLYVFVLYVLSFYFRPVLD